jgi:hypothetical protein
MKPQRGSLDVWAGVVLSFVISLLGLSSWVHSTFYRRDDAKEFREVIETRLERIELKIDRAFSNRD